MFNHTCTFLDHSLFFTNLVDEHSKMTERASKITSIVSQEGLVPFIISQLSPAVANAQVFAKGTSS
jgi:hypothetical protein